MHCIFPKQRVLGNGRIDFLREFEIVDPTSEDANPNGPVVGQEHVKDFGDPFIPERVYNGWKGKKDFEMIKVVPEHKQGVNGREEIKRMQKNFWGFF